MLLSNHYEAIEKNLAYGLTIRPSSIHGEGCFATVHFFLGSQIANYVGEQISRQEARRRRFQDAGHKICDLDTNWSIDGKCGGNGTDFINHSCIPNCEMIIKERQILVFALRDINPGEEITIAYLEETAVLSLPCLCPLPQCQLRRLRKEMFMHWQF